MAKKTAKTKAKTKKKAPATVNVGEGGEEKVDNLLVSQHPGDESSVSAQFTGGGVKERLPTREQMVAQIVRDTGKTKEEVDAIIDSREERPVKTIHPETTDSDTDMSDDNTSELVPHTLIYTIDGRTFATPQSADELCGYWHECVEGGEELADFMDIMLFAEAPIKNARQVVGRFHTRSIMMISADREI